MISLSRRGLIAAAVSIPASRAFGRTLPLTFGGKFMQGAAVIGRTAPRAEYSVDGEVLGKASANGLFAIGFDRDAKPEAKIGVSTPDGSAEHRAQIAPVKYDIQNITGLPQETVTPQGDALLARIAAESDRKKAGFARNADADWFSDGFVMPLDGFRVSGRFGGQRILNGTPSTPHYGADLAAPKGTPIHAPGKGLVAFAETGLFYEGGLVLIDHGQGLVSAYLHMSRVDVAKGQMLERGDRIGLVGMEGRATGPHLCWRMKWRARNCDPTLLVGVHAPTT